MPGGAVIQALRCEGYKAFSRPLNLELRPITVFFGKNNSGKTTLARLPLVVAASLTNPDSLYALSAHGLSFGSSFLDLATASNPHPAVALGIQWSPRRRLLLELQYVSSREEPDSVQPTFIDLDGSRNRVQLRRKRTETPQQLVESVLAPPAQRRLRQRIQMLEDLLDRLIHIPSSRPKIETIYTVRPPAAWTVDEVPHLLRATPRLLTAVDLWFREHVDGSGLDIDQAVFAFRMAEIRDDLTVNFAQSGRGPHSVLPVVTLLLAVASGIRRAPLVIVEEPEAHLHPSVHGDLADLVIACASKSQIIIETHSENFLLRLRRRIAESTLPNTNVALYFIDDAHNVLPIELDAFGTTDKWPSGVFESDVDEARAIIEAKISAMGTLGDRK
jgi:hypothetical protein